MAISNGVAILRIERFLGISFFPMALKPPDGASKLARAPLPVGA
jgi:hypothetical protein